MEIQNNQNQDLTNFLQTRVRELQFIPIGLVEILNKVSFSIGISNSLSQTELDLIFNHLKKEHKLVKIEEIDDAFSKYSAEKLKFMHLGKEVRFIEHFNKFDNTFISRVLNAYEKYKQENIKPEPKPQLPIPEDTPKQAFDFIEKIFNKTGKEPLLANWNLAFRHAEESKLIVLTNEEKAMFQENVRFEIEEEMNYKRVRKLNGWIDLREILESKSLMAYECRKRILINYFNGRTNK